MKEISGKVQNGEVISDHDLEKPQATIMEKEKEHKGYQPGTTTTTTTTTTTLYDKNVAIRKLIQKPEQLKMV